MRQEFRRITSNRLKGKRLDHYLILSGIGISRNRVIKLIEEGKVLVNDKRVKPSYRIKPGDRIIASLEIEEGIRIVPQSIELNIVYEDPYIIVLDKPKGMVVHPARGHPDHTIVNGLLYHCKNLPSSPKSKIRPGVIHRLDKDTTGLLVFAKTDESLSFLGREIERRNIKREYLAIVWGDIGMKEGEIEAPIGRYTLNRKKMAVTPFASKKAITKFKVLERFKIATLLSLSLLTGRTHQIRVHLLHYGHPVVGDPDYGGRGKDFITKRTDFPIYKEILTTIDRQALHAAKLGFIHPKTKKYMEFTSPMPEDMERVLTILRALKKK